MLKRNTSVQADGHRHFDQVTAGKHHDRIAVFNIPKCLVVKVRDCDEPEKLRDLYEVTNTDAPKLSRTNSAFCCHQATH